MKKFVKAGTFRSEDECWNRLCTLSDLGLRCTMQPVTDKKGVKRFELIVWEN